MILRMKNFNSMEFTEKSIFRGGGCSRKSNIQRGLPKKGRLGQFADLRGQGLAKKGVFLRGRLIPQFTLWVQKSPWGINFRKVTKAEQGFSVAMVFSALINFYFLVCLFVCLFVCVSYSRLMTFLITSNYILCYFGLLALIFTLHMVYHHLLPKFTVAFYQGSCQGVFQKPNEDRNF